MKSSASRRPSAKKPDQPPPGAGLGCQSQAQENRLLLAMLDKTAEAACVFDGQGQVLYLNQAHERLFGRPLAAPGKLAMSVFYAPQGLETLEAEVWPALRRGENWQGETKGRTTAGRLLPLWQRCFPVLDEQGDLRAGYALIEDLSRQQRAEQALQESQARYLAILEDQTELICRSDAQGLLTFVNEAYCRFFAKSREELLGRQFLPHLPEGEGGRLAQHLESLNRDNPLGSFTHRVVAPSGQLRWLRWTTRAIYDQHGMFRELQSVGRDVSERVQAEQELRASQARYLAILEDQTELICRSDAQGRLTFVNEAYCRFFAKSRQQLLGHHFLPNLPEEDGRRLAQHLASLNRENRLASLEHRVYLDSGQMRWLRWTTRAIFDQGGEFSEFQSVGRDVTERRQAEEALREAHANLETRVAERTQELKEANFKLALALSEIEAAREELQRISFQDGLTGVANRRYFDDQAGLELRRAAREQRPLAVIMADIDYFKFFNDTYGHQAGDDCLRQVAQALAGRLKRPGDFLARYGGEEFVAVLPGADLDGAASLAEEMRQAVEGLEITHAQGASGGRVTVSLGVAAWTPAGGDHLEPLVQAADQALYQAKQAGRNRVARAGFSPS